LARPPRRAQVAAIAVIASAPMTMVPPESTPAPTASAPVPPRAGWLRWVGSLTIAGLVLGIAVALATDERWLVSAKVLLQIGPETAGSRPSMVGSPAPFLNGNPRREDVQTEVELLNSGHLLRRAFDKLLAEDPDAALGPESNVLVTMLHSL